MIGDLGSTLKRRNQRAICQVEDGQMNPLCCQGLVSRTSNEPAHSKADWQPKRSGKVPHPVLPSIVCASLVKSQLLLEQLLSGTFCLTPFGLEWGWLNGQESPQGCAQLAEENGVGGQEGDVQRILEDVLVNHVPRFHHAEAGICFLGRLRAAALGRGQAHTMKRMETRGPWSWGPPPGGTGWQGCFPTPCSMLEALTSQSSLEPRWPAVKHDQFLVVLLDAFGES